MPDKKQPHKKSPPIRQIGLAMTIPMTLLAGPLVGWFIGERLDLWLGSAPWGKSILLILGTIAGIRQTIKMIKMMSHDGE